MLPEIEIRVFNQLDEGDQQSPRMRTQGDESLEQNPE
jgi:hypothetical protein